MYRIQYHSKINKIRIKSTKIENNRYPQIFNISTCSFSNKNEKKAIVSICEEGNCQSMRSSIFIVSLFYFSYISKFKYYEEKGKTLKSISRHTVNHYEVIKKACVMKY